MNHDNSSDFRTVRGYQLANQQEGHLTPALEDYLEMTYRLCTQNNYARVGKLSELLHVKPSSVSKMVSKLSELGYLEYDRYEIILLTDKGRETGAYLLDRHNTVEAFLGLIGCVDPLEETELIEHSLNRSTVQHLDALLVFFKTNNDVQQRFLQYRQNKNRQQDVSSPNTGI